jgi:predicted acylesterase/phospholipase RssA
MYSVCVVGTSTGALLAFLLQQNRSLAEIEHAFRTLCSDVFSRYSLIAYPSLLLSGAYYSSGPFESILKATYGAQPLIESSARYGAPRVFATSCVVSGNIPYSFVHRNYQFHPALTSTHAGSCMAPAWQVLRASTAAPTYFGPMPIGTHLTHFLLSLLMSFFSS